MSQQKQENTAYFSQAQTWETSRVQEMVQSKKVAWRVAGAACVVAVLAVGALAGLTPLKTVQPYVIRMDSITGIVDVATPLTNGKQTYEEAISKYFVQWYVRYRESYTKSLATEYYTNVGLMSSPSEAQRYFASFEPRNPKSPLNIYGDTAKVSVNVKSTSFIAPNIALVRYIKLVQKGADPSLQTHWVATITFNYSSASVSERDRGINPLGFTVTDYRNDPDSDVVTTPQTAPVVPPDPVVGAGVGPSVVPALIPPETPPPAPVVPAIQ